MGEVRPFTKRNLMTIIHLELNTWIGSAPGASHFYAQLKPELGEGSPVSLGYNLTTRQAIAVNKSLVSNGFSTRYDAGDWYEGFISKDLAIKVAKKTWRNYFPGGTFLVLGERSSIEPKPILDGAVDNIDAIKEESAKIIAECERLGWYDNPKNDKIMDQYYLVWARLVGADDYDIKLDETIILFTRGEQ